MKNKLVQGFSLLFWVIVWGVCAHFVAQPLLFPSPFVTCQTLFQLIQTQAFWQDIFSTLYRVITGFMCAGILGTLLGMLCGFLKNVDILLAPIKKIIRATPVSSFIILVLLWIRKDNVPIFISFLMVLPIVWENVQMGILKTDKKLLQMAKAYSFSNKKKFLYIYLPSVRPFLKVSLVTGLGFAWKSGIAAEVISRPMFAVGSRLQDAKVYLETPELFAFTLVVILLSILIEKALKYFLNKEKNA